MAVPATATTAIASNGVADTHVTFNRVLNRVNEWIRAGPNASANTKHPPAWTKSKPTPFPT